MDIIESLKNPFTRKVVHATRARLAVIKNGSPAKKMYVIGVTGTKGKTTTTHLISSILAAAGQKVGHLSTVEFKVGSKIITNDTNKTNLPPNELQALLKQMADANTRYLVMEVSSHGIAQDRVWGIPFKTAVFTNLQHDHLDYHGTFEEYRCQKIRLFTTPGLENAIVNGEDKSASHFLKATCAKEKFVYTTTDMLPSATKSATIIQAVNISLNPTGSTFRLVNDLGSVQIKLKLPGQFNIKNALAAATVALSLNIKLGTIKEGLEAIEQIPGRMEKIETSRGFSVIVDYAHTPDSLEQILQTLRPIVRGKIIAVFGATGDRDKTKRPIMGAIAARYADRLILTDEEPYSEDPASIIEEIAAGVPRGRALFAGKKTKNRPRMEMKVQDVKQFLVKTPGGGGEGDWWWKIMDRKAAIEKAITMAGFDDLVLITGMGAQNYKIVKDEKVPWNDRKVVEEILVKYKFVNEQT